VYHSVSGSGAEGELIKSDGMDQTLFIILMGFLKSPVFRISILVRMPLIATHVYPLSARVSSERAGYNIVTVTLDEINPVCNQLDDNENGIF